MQSISSYTSPKHRKKLQRRLRSNDPYNDFEEWNIPRGLGYGKNFYAPQTLITDNSYWNVTTKRTYKELHDYYKPLDFYNPYGYYSTYYSNVYYDGYGYNFYYGNTGYYEYSRPPNKIVIIPFEPVDFLQVFAGMVLFLAFYSVIAYKSSKKVSSANTKDLQGGPS